MQTERKVYFYKIQIGKLNKDNYNVYYIQNVKYIDL